MDRRNYLAHLMRSPEGVAGLAASLAAGVITGLLTVPVAGFLCGAAVFSALVAVVTLSGQGSRIAVREQQRRTWAAARPFLEEAKETRKRLAAMRVPDAEVKAALELVATRGASYLSACLGAQSRDPLADDALAGSLSLADIYLKELDGAATERRFALPDGDPFPESRARVLAALKANAAILEKAALDLSGGLSPADRMVIKESL